MLKGEIMSEGQRLVNALIRINYLPAYDLDVSSFDWLFENENLASFFRVFCDSVEAGNFLSNEENEEFHEMMHLSESILVGNELEKALHCLDTYSEEYADDCVKEEIQDLVKELASVECYANHLVHQRNFLSLHETQLCLHSTALDELACTLEKNVRYLETEEESLDKKVGSCLNSITTTIQDFALLFQHESCFGDEYTFHKSPLNVNLRSYQTSEHRVLEQLKSYIQIHFGKALPLLSENDSVLDYCNQCMNGSLEQIVQGSNDAIRHREIDRIRIALKTCEEERLKSIVSVCHAEGEVDFYRSKIKHGTLSFLPLSAPDLGHQMDKAKDNLNEAHCVMIEMKKSIGSKVHQWCNEYQNSYILLETYEQKLKRQGYFLSKQENILNHLVYQHVRQILTHIALSLKKNQLQNIYNVLQEFDSSIKEDWKTFCERTAWMQSYQKNFQLQELSDNTIDSLSNILRSESHPTALYVTTSAISDICEQMQIKNASAESELQHIATEQMNQLQIAEMDLKTLEQSSVGYGQETLIMASNIDHKDLIHSAVRNFDSKIQILEQSLLSSIREVDKTRKAVTENAVQVQHRNLFLYFFLEPNKLVEKVQHLQIDIEGERLLNL